MDDVKDQDIAEYFVTQSWTMLDWVKFIVEHAIDNPSSNLEPRLYDMMYKGVSKTLTDINQALDANKTLSEETKAAYHKDFQSYLKELQKWMYAAYRSKTLVYPQYKYLKTQQQMLFERLPEIKARYKTEEPLTAKADVKADLGSGKAGDAKTIAATPETKHSIDFRSVCWFGTNYNFTPNQAAAVEILWKAWENGTPDVGGDTIAVKVESDSRRARDIFKKHPAFGSMIRRGQTKGTYRLVKPDK
ncbi:MAG: hypothetical protein ACYSU6_00790 [Planctomycetota bacterium]|jgi:hypothetical protein